MSRTQRRYLLFVVILLAIEILVPFYLGVDAEKIRLLRDKVYRGEITLPNYLPHAYHWHMPTEFSLRLFWAYLLPISILNFIVAMIIVLKYRHSTIITLLQDLRLAPDCYRCAMRILFSRFSVCTFSALLLTPQGIAMYLGSYYEVPFFYLPYLLYQGGLGLLILLTDRVHVVSAAAGSDGWQVGDSVAIVVCLAAYVFLIWPFTLKPMIAIGMLLLIYLLMREIHKQISNLGQPQEYHCAHHIQK